jgi:hypothetical protein
MLKGTAKESVDALLEGVRSFQTSRSRGSDHQPHLFDHLRACCFHFYGSETTSWQGTVGFPTETVFPPQADAPTMAPDTIIPIMEDQIADPSAILKKGLLLSNFLVMVVPRYLGTSSISYSGGGLPLGNNQASLSDCATINADHSLLLEKHQAVFLPEKIYERHESTWDGKSITYKAPFEQHAESLSYVPCNTSPMKVVELLGNIQIPYFPDISIEDLITIKLQETDAFPRFQYFLKKKLREFGEGATPNKLRELSEEIESEVHRLNLEAKRLSKLRIMQGSVLERLQCPYVVL